MKKILFLLLLSSVLPVMAGTLRTNVLLVWDYPFPDATNCEFRIYSTNNAASPMPWPVYGVAAAGVTNFPVLPLTNMQFFYVTATNVWGESDPSNVALCPAPPRSDIILRVR